MLFKNSVASSSVRSEIALSNVNLINLKCIPMFDISLREIKILNYLFLHTLVERFCFALRLKKITKYIFYFKCQKLIFLYLLLGNFFLNYIFDFSLNIKILLTVLQLFLRFSQLVCEIKCILQKKFKHFKYKIEWGSCGRNDSES